MGWLPPAGSTITNFGVPTSHACPCDSQGHPARDAQAFASSFQLCYPAPRFAAIIHNARYAAHSSTLVSMQYFIAFFHPRYDYYMLSF
jgi:hypothetical protein